MSEWTPERIAAAREEMDAPSPLLMWPEHRLISTDVCADLLDLARIGLAVVSADEATVERVARALYEQEPLEDSVDDLDGRTVHAGALTWEQAEASAYVRKCREMARAVLLELGKVE